VNVSFRLGSTSYVYPGDLLWNATRLAGQVQDMELVLFAVPGGESNFPTPAEVAQLADLGTTHNLTYTVHLPADLRYSPRTVHPSLQIAQQVIELTAPLQPFAYIFHLEGTGAGEAGWLDQAQHALHTLLDWVADPQRLALENLESYAPEALEPLFARFPISRTLDIGHLWKAGRDPWPVLEQWLPTTRVIHLHGMAEFDHRSLAVMRPEQLDPLVERLLDWPGVLTLEVFEADFFTSRQALQAALQRVTA
jgi:sugar phosphate isomerase/epimerase